VKTARTSRYLSLGSLALAAIASLSFLAACGSGSEDGPSGPTVPTLSDYVGTWAQGPSVGVTITLTVSADGKYSLFLNSNPTPTEQGTLYIDSRGMGVCVHPGSLFYSYSYSSGSEWFYDLNDGEYSRLSGDVGTVVGLWSGIHGEASSRLTMRGDYTFTQVIGTLTFNGTYDDNVLMNAGEIEATISINASSVPKTLNYVYTSFSGIPILLAKQ
jgi:hypothetical protein